MRAVRARGVWSVLHAIAALLFANPPRKPLNVCICGTANDPDIRAKCMNCGRPV